VEKVFFDFETQDLETLGKLNLLSTFLMPAPREVMSLLQKSIPAQIRQLIRNNKGWVDRFVRMLTFAQKLYEYRRARDARKAEPPLHFPHARSARGDLTVAEVNYRTNLSTYCL